MKVEDQKQPKQNENVSENLIICIIISSFLLSAFSDDTNFN